MTVTIKSKEQLLGTWVRRIKNNTDITDFQAGGALVTLMEAIAQQVYQAQLSVLKVLEITEVDNLTDKRLDDLAESLKIPNGQGGIGRQAALQATGSVVVGSAFTKISTRAYAGKPAPYAGSKVLYVQDASEMFAKTPVNGKIYIGRNTIDTFEGPLSYSSISTTGTYWIINLVDPLTKDHPYTDEIVLAQGGDRNINASAVVQVPAYADARAIQFTTDVAVVLPDGEDSVTVPVTCTQFGVIGNVASGAITEFATVPFSGAVVSNQQTFVNGSDTESDASLRQRIKDYPNTLARGTVGAMNAALLSVVDADTKKKVTSASVVRPLEQGEPTTVYIDDGTLLEPVFAGQDYELLLAKASGLEQGFKTAQAPVTPAVVAAAKAAPYVLEAGMTITFLIDNIPYVYTITPSNYKDLTAATAYELVRDLNADPEGILDFRVTENGTKIVAIDRTNAAEEIKVISGTLQDRLGFPTISQRPIYLYKNGILQSFKGKTATISSNPFSNWSITGASYTGLKATIDGVLVDVSSITNDDFLARFGISMTVATADNWREILQSKIPGVTVIFQDNRFIITSNKENSASSEIVISAGTWIGSASIFSSTLAERSSVGASKDYTFNRYTGDIRFVSRLTAGDIIEIASLNTRAFVKSSTTSTGKYDISNDYPGFGPAKFIVAVDDAVSVKTTGNPNNGVLQVTDVDANQLTVSLKDKLGNGLFINAEIGDYLYLTSIKENSTTPITGFTSVSDATVGFYRIKKIIKGATNTDTVVVEVSAYQAASTGFVLNDEYGTAYKGSAIFKIFASDSTPQVITLPSSTAALVEDVVTSINNQIVGAEAERSTGQYFFLRTNTYVNGSLSVLATFGKANNIFTAASKENLQAHVGSSNSNGLDSGFPIVTESVVPSSPSAGMATREYLKIQKNYTDITQTSQNPIIEADSSIASYPVGFQELWVTGKLLGWTGRSYNNETTAPYQGFLRTDSAIRPIGAVTVTANNVNRYANISFRMQDLALTPFDKFVVEMDLDASNKTVNLPLYKKAIVSSQQLIGNSGRGQKYQFTLKDPEDFNKEFFDVTSPFKNFDFNDFKIVGKSVGVYKLNSAGAGPNEAALVVRSSSFGGANRIKLNILYPQSPSQPDIKISHANAYGTEEVLTTVNVEMPSQAVIPSTIFTGGTYKVTGVSTANNLTDITLSTQAAAVTATAKMEDYTPYFNISFLARASGFAGVLGNNIELVIQDSGHTGIAGTVQMISQSTKKVVLDLNGSTPNATALTAALASSTYLESASGTGNLALKANAYNYVAEVAAKITNPYYTLTFNQIDFNPKIRGASGNAWSFRCISTGGSGPAVASVNTSTKVITVDLQGQLDFPLSSLQTLLNSVVALNGAIAVTGTFTVGGSPVYLSTSSQTFFTGGVTKQNTLYTADGVDATDGIFASGLYSVNNLLQVSGIQESDSMPIGIWPIVDKPSLAEIKIRVPNYNGLSGAVFLNKEFNASEYQIQSFPVLPKTLQNLADALNSYLADAPVVSAQVLGLSTTNVLMPNGAQVPRSTYINYTNTNTLPSYATNPSEAIKFHAFSANRSEGASIYEYNQVGNSIKSVVQSADSIFPAGNAILGTAYSSVGEEIYLLPTNTATFNRWANFAPASAMPIQANISRAEKASKVQISSKLRGTKGSVYAKETLANKYKTTVLDAASAENNSVYFPLLTSQTKQLPKSSLVQITNAVAADLLRPFRVASPTANITAANTANEKTWVRKNANIIYEKTSHSSGNYGRLYFLRNGQSATIGTTVVTATEPLDSGTVTVQANTPSSGLATITYTGTKSLSARIGDMMYVSQASAFNAEVKCPSVPTGLSMSASFNGLSGYVGYPVVQVNSATEVIVIAPNITSNNTGVSIGAGTDLVFVPVLFTEKNIKTHYSAGPKGVEIASPAGTSGTHSEWISNKYSYGILKKLSNGFSALILSNTSDNTTIPVAASDTMLLSECGVNTDDYVFLNGFGAGADGQYQLVAHDGKNTAILYSSTLPLEDIVYDTNTRNTNDVGQTWWGAQLKVSGYENPAAPPAGYTIDPRPVRIIDAESVVVGCKLKIASAALGTSDWFSQSLVGVWNITNIGIYSSATGICQFIEFEIPNGAPAGTAWIKVNAANEENLSFVEKQPFSAFRMVQGWSIDPKNTENSQVYLTPSKSYQKISNALGTEIQCIHKLGYETVPKTGVDGYKIFGGLVREAQRTLDGVPTSISRYPGIKSTGTDVSVLPPIPRAVAVTFRVRTRDGLSINVIAGTVRSSVASFVSSLGLGQSVILSELISLVQDIPGIVSVEIISTLPTAVDGKIAVADNEKAVIIDAATNISVGQ